MSNNKSSVEWYAKQLAIIADEVFKIGLTLDEFHIKKYELLEQAKAQHKKETIDFALHCMMPNMEPDKSTIEVVSDIYDEYFGGDE